MRARVTAPVLLLACGTTIVACAGAERERAEQACEDGDTAACRSLGELRLAGSGGPEDKKGGREAFERACDLGDGPSCGMAGSLVYARRDGQARRWLRRGCDLDHFRSCTTMAWMLLHGEGGDADPSGARAAFDKACRGGEAAACVFAAMALPEDGSPGGGGAAGAREGWLERACSLGDTQACAGRRGR